MSARDLPPELTRDAWALVPAALRASIRASVARGLEALKTPEPLTLHQWAEKNFYLSAESSQGEKRWASFPYQRGLLCMMGDDHIQEVDVLKSARVGYTKMLLASIAYGAQHKRRNQCVWQPTDADSDEFCKAEVEPMLRDVGAMQSVFPSHMRKSKSNTLNMKKFLGSLLFLKGGTSSGNYRRMTLQTFYADEFSAFDQKIEKSADPWTLMWKRLEGATWPKAIVGSTPRVKGFDHTERRFLASTARMRFHVECPSCGAEHPLQWGGPEVQHGFKWDAHDPEGTVHHVCPHCHYKLTQAEYLRVWHTGLWVSDCGNYRCHATAGGDYFWTDGTGCKLTVPPRHVGAHVWTAYSPQTTWAVIVREFLHALAAFRAGDKGAMEGFVNETRGETWEEEVEKADSHELQRRAEAYPLRRVPVGGLDLVQGVDTQDKWWAVTTLAIGRHGEKWLVDYVEFEGNPGDLRDWESKLYPYLKSTFHHWHGAPMRVTAVAVDTGGNHTHTAYEFCRAHAAEKIFAIKGDSADGKPIKGKSTMVDVNQKGRILKRGLKLWWVGTDTAKDLIFSQLMLKAAGPGYIHFSQGLTSAYYQGLTSEVRRHVRTASGVKLRWVQVRDRNEPLDTMVYALFASQALDHHKLTERQWERLEQALLPDLFEPAGTFVQPVGKGGAVIEVAAREVAGPVAERVAERVADVGQTMAAPAAVVNQPLTTAPASAVPAPVATPAADQPAAPRTKRAAALPKPRPAPAVNPFAPADWLGRGFE